MRFLLIILCLFSILPLQAQDSDMIWQQTFGGEGDDQILSSTIDQEGNILLVGSIQNTYTTPINNDIYLIKMTPGGIPVWEKRIGGSGDEQGNQVIALSKNKILVAGSTSSTNGPFSENNGLLDMFVMLVDANGEIERVATFGGNSLDYGQSVIQLSNGNILLSGSSRSQNWSSISNTGQFDIVLLELDLQFKLLNALSIGGPDDEIVREIKELDNGNIALLSSSTTYIDAYSDNRGDQDIVVYMLNQNKSIAWQKSYGGFLTDQPADLVELDNGNLLVAGYTFSNDFDISTNMGGSDGWLFEIDPAGDILWETSFGGENNDEISSIYLDSENVLHVLGTTNRTKNAQETNTDFWLFSLDVLSKDKIDQHYFGASGVEQAASLLLIPGGTIIMCGNKKDEDPTNFEIKEDGWVLAIRAKSANKLKVSAHPNPTSGLVYLNNFPDGASLSVFTLSGERMLVHPQYFPGAQIIDFNSLPSGLYLIQVTSEDLQQTIRIVKQ